MIEAIAEGLLQGIFEVVLEAIFELIGEIFTDVVLSFNSDSLHSVIHTKPAISDEIISLNIQNYKGGNS